MNKTEIPVEVRSFKTETLNVEVPSFYKDYLSPKIRAYSITESGVVKVFNYDGTISILRTTEFNEVPDIIKGEKITEEEFNHRLDAAIEKIKSFGLQPA